MVLDENYWKKLERLRLTFPLSIVEQNRLAGSNDMLQVILFFQRIQSSDQANIILIEASKYHKKNRNSPAAQSINCL